MFNGVEGAGYDLNVGSFVHIAGVQFSAGIKALGNTGVENHYESRV